MQWFSCNGESCRLLSAHAFRGAEKCRQKTPCKNRAKLCRIFLRDEKV